VLLCGVEAHAQVDWNAEIPTEVEARWQRVEEWAQPAPDICSGEVQTLVEALDAANEAWDDLEPLLIDPETDEVRPLSYEELGKTGQLAVDHFLGWYRSGGGLGSDICSGLRVLDQYHLTRGCISGKCPPRVSTSWVGVAVGASRCSAG
jgi:hypothetical protein